METQRVIFRLCQLRGTYLYYLNRFNTGYTDTVTYQDQKNFVASVLYLDPSKEFPEGLIITGGNDNIILVYRPSEPSAMLTITEHSNTGEKL